MRSSVLYSTAIFSLIAGFLPQSSLSNGFSYSQIEGTIFIRGASGETIPLPTLWQNKDMLLGIINFEGRHLDNDAPLYTVRKDHKEIVSLDANYFDFSTTLYEEAYTRAAIYIKVFHDGYFLEKPIYNFYGHDGEKSIGTLYVERRYFNDGERRREVLDFLKLDSYTQSEVGTTYTILKSLMMDRANPEDFFLLVQMVSKLLKDQGRLPPDLVGDLQNLVAVRALGKGGDTQFSALETEDQFNVLGGLAYWLARAPEPKQAVLPNLTYYQLAQQFFASTVEIAFSHTDALNQFDIANVFQNYYKLECKLGLPEDCFTVIQDFTMILDVFKKKNIPFPDSRIKSFLADYRLKVEELSEYGTGKDPTDQAFIERIATDPEMRAHWRGFLSIALTDHMQSIVNGSRGLTKTVNLASAIQEYPSLTN